MGQYRVTRTINAPVGRVFETVANIEGFSEAVPDIVGVEFLSEQRRGLGAKFKETRIMKGREVSSVLEVTEYIENERVRLVSDQGGTVWDSAFTLRPSGDQTLLELTMDARPYKLLARFVNLMIKPVLTKALASDMDAVKAYCEKE